MILQLGIGVAVTAVALWLLLLAVLVVARPKDMTLRDARRFVPDTVRLLRNLAGDNMLPRRVRRRLVLLLAYLALPVDLVPDFLPVIGYADDVTVVAVALRSVVRAAGRDAIDRHWTGSPAGLKVVHRLAGTTS
jgi:uncharacterized membrane protein YkvA (DUF1232 family)